MVKGTPDSHLASNAACIAYVSSEANCRLRLDACCFSSSFTTPAPSSERFVDIVTRSKSRCRNMRQVVSRSRNSLTHGPHQVAQKFTRRTLSLPFARRALRSAADAASTFTGSASILANAWAAVEIFDFHLVEHPKTGVWATATGWPATRASRALRASWVFTRDSRWLLSMWPS